MTANERKALVDALADWRPEGLSAALTDEDREWLRDSVTTALALALRLGGLSDEITAAQAARRLGTRPVRL